MLIIHRIVGHLHDRQKVTVFPPFNSPAKYGGSRFIWPITAPPGWVQLPPLTCSYKLAAVTGTHILAAG